LEETELGIGLLLILTLDSLLNGGVDLRVDLGSGEGAEVNTVLRILTRFNKGSLDQTGNFLDVGLSINCCFYSTGLNSGLLLNSKYQTHWHKCLSKFAES
jgi:hypothetical protein